MLMRYMYEKQKSKSFSEYFHQCCLNQGCFVRVLSVCDRSTDQDRGAKFQVDETILAHYFVRLICHK